jgi:ATP-binding cassette subfamily B (MDR/TAP) protein 1
MSFWRLFEFADGLDWALMAAGALVVYLHLGGP